MPSHLQYSLFVSLCCSFVLSARVKPGDADPSFDAGGYPLGGANTAALVRPDGSLIVAGPSPINSSRNAHLVRILPNGHLDRNFGRVGELGVGGAITVLAEAPGGRIYVGGNLQVDPQPGRSGLIAVNQQGRVDPSFQPVPIARSGVRALAVQPDGRLLVGRSIANGQTTTRQPLLVRLLVDGSLDPDFEIVLRNTTNEPTAVESILPLADGRLLVGGRFHLPEQSILTKLVRLQANGLLDPTFTEPSNAAAAHSLSRLIAVPEGGVAVVAQHTGALQIRSVVLRLGADGDLDPVYREWEGRAPFPSITAITPIIGGVLMGGVNGLSPIDWLASTNDGITVRLTPTRSGVASLGTFPDGSWVAVGGFTEAEGLPRPGFVRVLVDGTPDPNYGRIGFSSQRLVVEPNLSRGSLVPLPDGGLLVASGPSFFFNGLPQRGLARLLPDGALDLNFKPDLGPTPTDFGVYWASLTPDDRILIWWYRTRTGQSPLAKLHFDGRIDTNFVSGLAATASIRAIRIASDGFIYVGGERLSSVDGSGLRVRRLDPAGQLDAAYLLPLNSLLMAVHPDGRVLASVAGDLRRFLTDGTPDNSFQSPTGSQITRVEAMPDGSVLASGSFDHPSGSPTTLARWLPDGRRDLAFQRFSGRPPTDLVTAPLDRFITGPVTLPETVARRLSTGGVDPSFSVSTNAAGLQSLATHGDFLFGFEITRPGSRLAPERRLVRYHNYAYSLSAPQPSANGMTLELIAPAGELHVLEGSGDLVRWDALATNTVPEANRILWKVPVDIESAGEFFREYRQP